jgi:hypothetical protein
MENLGVVHASGVRLVVTLHLKSASQMPHVTRPTSQGTPEKRFVAAVVAHEARELADFNDGHGRRRRQSHDDVHGAFFLDVVHAQDVTKRQ